MQEAHVLVSGSMPRRRGLRRIVFGREFAVTSVSAVLTAVRGINRRPPVREEEVKGDGFVLMPSRAPQAPELLLPGSDLISAAAGHIGESLAQRVQRMVQEDGVRSPAATSDGVSALLLGIRAVQSLRSGMAETSRALFVQAVSTFPEDPETHFNMGLYYEVLHEPDKMVRWMDMAIELNPQHCGAWVLRSKYMEHRGRHDEAIRGYTLAVCFQSDSSLAASQLAGITSHQRACIEPRVAGSHWYEAISSFAGGRFLLPEWQENFLHCVTPPLPRQPLLADVEVAVWDDVLSEELLAMVEDSVDDYFQFVFTNGWIYSIGDGVGNAATSWLPATESPVTAPELAAQLLLRRLIMEDPGDFAGVEFWGRVRSENLGAGLHYDQAEDDLDTDGDWVFGNPWRPRWSSVLYLTDEGGPTVIMEQVHTHGGRHVPLVPRRGYCAMPRRNRWVVFRGDLFHGTLPVELQRARMRRVFVFNFWRSHVPAAPHCQRLELRRHAAMRRLELSAQELDRLRSAEASLPPPRSVPRQSFSRLEEMPHSSDFGYLPLRMPMPSAKQLKESTGLCEVNWADAAAMVVDARKPCF